VPTNPDRSSYFPAIERKHGQPMSYWFDVMSGIADLKYPEQIAYLRDNHGFSQAHANALVLYCRGNTSSRRFDTFEGYLTGHDQVKQATVRRIFAVLGRAFPRSEVVIAWNHPMLKQDGRYLFGVSIHTSHITIAPFGDGVIEALRPRLTGYEVNKKTVRVPVDWDVDEALIVDMVAADHS
jgi:uncharacterized protein YdhG (YjbR/CyaY superfamily)